MISLRRFLLPITFFIFSIPLLSQPKTGGLSTNIERFKIYVVEKLDKITPTGESGYIPESATGDEHNYLLLDTQTGKTWILTNIGSEITNSEGKKLKLGTFAWKPIFFQTNVPLPWSTGLSKNPD